MKQSHQTIPELVVHYVKRQATPSEITQLEEWASLSVKNRNWLDRFNDRDWIASSIIMMKQIDVEKSKRELQRRMEGHRIRKAKIRRRWKVAGYTTTTLAAMICGLVWWLNPKTQIPESARKAVITKMDVPEGRVFKREISKIPGTNPSKKTTLLTEGSTHVSKDRRPITDVTRSTNSPNKAVGTGDQRDEFDRSAFVDNLTDKVNAEYIAAGKEQQTGLELQMHYITNPRRSLMQKKMPDGSEFWLNAVSDIVYPYVFTGSKRKIEIKGEGYFEVMPDTTSFLVAVKDIHVETWDGSFNLKAYEDEGEVIATAISGTLRVAAGPYEVLLNPGESAVIAHGMPIVIVRKENTDKVLAWKKGIFLFENEKLPVVARELARWSEMNVRYDSNSNTLISFSGPRTMKGDALIEKITTTNPAICLEKKENELIMY